MFRIQQFMLLKSVPGECEQKYGPFKWAPKRKSAVFSKAVLTILVMLR
jgi:hypothetical protein